MDRKEYVNKVQNIDFIGYKNINTIRLKVVEKIC
jgi:hypothetical protein